MQSIRLRRIHAAENPQVITELVDALTQRWAAAARGMSSHDAAIHAPIIAGMFAAMATEEEVADYVRTIEATGGGGESDAAFAAELLRIVLRLDEVGGRSP